MCPGARRVTTTAPRDPLWRVDRSESTLRVSMRSALPADGVRNVILALSTDDKAICTSRSTKTSAHVPLGLATQLTSLTRLPRNELLSQTRWLDIRCGHESW